AFFFQAEDGIRDRNVTGVQTCALPILFAALITLITPTVLSTFSGETIFIFFAGMMCLQLLFVWLVMPETKNRSLEELEDILLPRSEERRVGKGCRWMRARR